MSVVRSRVAGEQQCVASHRIIEAVKRAVTGCLALVRPSNIFGRGSRCMHQMELWSLHS